MKQTDNQSLRNVEAEEEAQATQQQEALTPSILVKCPGCGYEFSVTLRPASLRQGDPALLNSDRTDQQ